MFAMTSICCTRLNHSMRHEYTLEDRRRSIPQFRRHHGRTRESQGRNPVLWEYQLPRKSSVDHMPQCP